MKKQEWNDEQLEQLLMQLPPVKDKQTAEDVYQSIQHKKKIKRKSRTWIAPAMATVAALLIFALISPYLFQNFTSNEESAMDITSSSEDSAKMEKYSANENAEAKLVEENTIEQIALDEEKETFVTSASEAEETITVGFTDGNAQNILPVSLKANEKKEKLEQLEAINPEAYTKELGPITYELSHTEFEDEGNPEEIHIEYNGEPSLSSSVSEELYQKAIIETFRWLNYKKAKLYTNNKEGIEFGNTGPKKDIEVKRENNKAYFLYQFDEQTSKLLVPSPDPYASIDSALKAMKKGIEERNLKPTIMNIMTTIRTKEDGEQLEIEFNKGIVFEDNEPTIIMLESILLTAKEFGYKTVHFKGMNIEKVGVMDVTKPIEVPFSPNPIEAD